MNQEQILSLTRAVLQIVGTVLVTYRIGGMTDATWAPLAGAVLMIVPIVWGVYAHTNANAIAIADAIPDVAGVVTKPTTEGRALAHAAASSTVAVAGTGAAAAMVKK